MTPLSLARFAAIPLAAAAPALADRFGTATTRRRTADRRPTTTMPRPLP
jgi:hypothetical protein